MDREARKAIKDLSMSCLPLRAAEALPSEHAEQDQTEYTWKSEAGSPTHVNGCLHFLDCVRNSLSTHRINQRATEHMPPEAAPNQWGQEL